jgi:pyruvate/2-oxoglutarate dehydrogenase complex dihydrolipoamide dehydrogenase (E3) component
MAADPPPLEPGSVTQKEYLRRVRPAGWQNPPPKPLYDLAVVGAGPAGLAAVDLAVRHGLSVALIERNCLGGNSLNLGSIPSKAIIRTGRLFSAVRDSEELAASLPRRGEADFGSVMGRMRRIRSRIAEYSSVDRLQAAGVDVFFGSAIFEARSALRVSGAQVCFKKAVIATGARPRSSDIAGLAQVGYFTSDSIFDTTALPRRLGVIGGGPLGCELAQAFCRLGSHVTIVQNDPKFLPREERDAAELLSLALSRDGVETRLNTTVLGARSEKGEKLLDTVNNDVKYSISVDSILLSVGRVPNVEGMSLEAADIAIDPANGIQVDDFLCTTNAAVYAAGDVCSAHKFTNVAQASARIAVSNAFGPTALRQSHLTIPWCTYCDPEIAHIGLDAFEARSRGMVTKSFTVMMQDVDRAITDGQDDGFVKIYVRDGTDEILGASIVAARASEMINEVSVIMNAGIGMRQLARILHSYPAQSDAIRQAALAYVKNQAVEPW